VTEFCGKEAAKSNLELVGEFEKGPSRYLLQHQKHMQISISALSFIALMFILWSFGGLAIAALFFFGKDYGIAKGYCTITIIMALAAAIRLLNIFGYIEFIP
jgi:hypothetical protein